MSDHEQKNSSSTYYTPSKRLTPAAIELLRRKHTEELIEAAELELADLVELNNNHEEAIRRGKNPDKLPWMIENLEKAIKRFSESLEDM